MTRLAELLTIRTGEGRLAGLLITLMLMTALGSSVGVSGIEALFFARFGVTYLPLIYMVQGALTLIVTLSVSALLGGRSRNLIYTFLPLLMGGVLVAERFLAGLTEFLPVLWLSKEILNSLMGLYVWGVASALCDTRQAKRLFPIFNAGRILGSVAGGLATGLLVSFIGTENLLLVWAATLGVAFIITRALLAGNRPALPVKAKRTRARRTPSFLQEVQQGYQFVRGSALMRLVSIEAVLFSALWFSLALPFSKAVTLNFVDEPRIAGFLGLFNSLNTAAAFLASLFLANRLYARWGIMRVILVLPLIYVVGFGVMMAYAAFPVLVVYKFVQMVWLQGLADSAYQAMFNAVPGERRDQVRAFIGGVPEQAGTLIAGGILIVGEQTMQAQTLYGVGLLIAAACAYAVWLSGRAYSGALVAALKANQPQVLGTASLPFGGLQQDGTALQVARAGLTQPEPSVRRVAAEVLGAFPQPASVEALVRALTDEDAGVRVAVLQALIQTKASAALLDVAARLRDANAEVRAQAVAAVRALAGFPSGITAHVQPLLEDEAALVRVRAAVSLLQIGPHARAKELLRGLAMLGDAEERVLALKGLADWGDKEGFALIANELADKHAPASVRSAAALALAACGPDAAPTLIECLSEENGAVREATAKALGRLAPRDGGPGQPVVALVAQALFTPAAASGALRALEQLPAYTTPIPVRRFAQERSAAALRQHAYWRTLAPHTHDDALRLLADSLLDNAQQAGLQTLRALALLGERETYNVAIENLRSRETGQRANALEALETVREAAMVRPLLRVWESTAPTTETEFAPPWPELLNHEDEWIRACAAWAKRRFAKDEPMEPTTTLPLMERILFFRHVPLLADLTPVDLKQVAALAREDVFLDGEYLAEQGEPGEEMFIITSGAVGVLANEIEVARRQPGDVVGEMALISREPRMASLVARGDVRVLCIDRQSFEGLLRERPETSLAVMRVLCQRLKEMTK